MSCFKYMSIAVLALCGAVSVGHAKPLKGTRPNIIFVMTDDQGPVLSCMGHPVVRTPHIDQFAAQSLRLTDFQVSPTCAPTRAAVLSGRHEFKNGVTHTIRERELMALSTTTFPAVLQQAGYETGIFGKWHLGDIEEYWPINRGFSEALTHGSGGIGQPVRGSGADFQQNGVKGGVYFDNVLLHNRTVVQTKGYCTDLFFNAALGWMKKQINADKPFFAYIAPNAPHTPLIAPEENKARIQTRCESMGWTGKVRPDFWGMIENIDDNFGLMMQQLEAWGALENTLIIFTTDNGMHLKDGKHRPEWTGGYATGKTSPGEGGTHVPCFWHWKNHLESRDVPALTAHIDLYKTFCDLAGATIPANVQELEGRTLLPLLENPQASWADRQLFIHVGRWYRKEKMRRDQQYAVRTQRWRLVEGKLYDIAKDPFETQDVAGQYPEVVKELSDAQLQWWQETVPLMVNEDRTWAGAAPLPVLYEKQLGETGIPDWEPLPF